MGLTLLQRLLIEYTAWRWQHADNLILVYSNSLLVYRIRSYVLSSFNNSFFPILPLLLQMYL